MSATKSSSGGSFSARNAGMSQWHLFNINTAAAGGVAAAGGS
jgi:hypothetical protein